MDYSVHNYAGDGVEADWQFRADRIFASDVLAFVKDQGVLLTGLVNPQVIRTADMMDMRCVVLVRGKKATPEMTELAESISIVLMESDMRMYDACGRLFSAGLVGASVQ